MQIAIPATSASLLSLFSAGQLAILKAGKVSQDYHIEIQNNSAQIFHIEKGAAAVVATSAKVGIGKTLQIAALNLGDWFVISASGSINVEVLQLNP